MTGIAEKAGVTERENKLGEKNRRLPRDHAAYLASVRDTCRQCGACRCVHRSSLLAGAFTYGDLAGALLDLPDCGFRDDSLVRTVCGCDQCGFCLRSCPAGFDAKEFMTHARALLIERGAWDAAAYDPVRVDRAENLFARLRAQAGATFEDALETGAPCPRLFLPSCHGTARFPQVVQAAYQMLRRLDLVDGITAACCGNPLYAAGLYDEAEAYLARLDARLRACGVRQIVTPCPNCYAFPERMRRYGFFSDIQMVALPQLLVDAGVRVDPSRFPQVRTVSVHDSCPDRLAGMFSAPVRTLLEGFELIELPHVGRDTLCCGAGGLAPFGPDAAAMAEAHAAKRADYDRVRTDLVVATCFNCRNALAETLPVRHVLELLV